MSLKVTLIALTRFLGVPEEMAPRADQDQGSEGARLIECAGRICYDSYGKGRNSEDYHAHIMESGHGSVTEHVNLTFHIEGVSRALTHELVRHRHAAISQRSTRYVDESKSDWAWHPLIDRTDLELAQVKTLCRHTYQNLAEELQQTLEAKGLDRATARKQARGAARGVLGNALETALVWTVNVRALRGILEQRCSPYADAEIRLLANELYKIAVGVVPEYFSDYQTRECPDGIGFGITTDHRKL